MSPTDAPVGVLLREWRVRRRLTQLDLALGADVSTRHLSHLETGKARPTSAMIERLAEHLDVPLRERNRMLLAGGFAPAHPNNALSAPPMRVVSAAIQRVLAAHQPYPALVVDGHWELIESNSAVSLFTAGAAAELLTPPVNVLRLSLHPSGMAPRITNLAQWRAHTFDRLDRQLDAGGDAELIALRRELAGYPGGCSTPGDVDSIIVPLRYLVDGQELSFFSTTTIFGAPLDITVSELAIESFYPADDATGAFLRERQLT